MVLLDDIPIEFRISQQVFWKYLEVGGNMTKVPHKTLYTKAKVNDPSTWLSFDEVKDYKKKGFDGIGFVLTKDDPFIVIDLDGCIKDGKISDFARNVVDQFKSYTEISPSGKGLHIIIKGKLDQAIIKKGIEIYSDNRYICMTGNKIWDYDIIDGQIGIDILVKKYGPKPETPICYPKNFKDDGSYKLPKKIFTEGCRNNELARQCGVIKTKVKSENEYWFHVWEVNNKCCDPPLSQYEVSRMARRLWRDR